ncbi:MAG: GNAT family N-acetyltransferase [Rhodoferax sp.]|nr:GNAT family N-acetyltransferase [Rhodoferax sp.]
MANIRKAWREGLRKVFSLFPRSVRFAIFRSFVDCDPAPDKRLVLKIAETQEELEACFRLLHDAYVSSGFMKPAPSGLRATIYHALPTTTTLCAKFDGEVVGTLSLIRESVFGFPLQAIFDLKAVRARGGKIAEVSALAVHPDFRKTGGAILFPLMKFMYEYCTTFFDTRHLVIAVHPNRIEMYESLLFFKRLAENKVDNYDFANGAPAVGATLDLRTAPRKYQDTYGKKPRRKNLYDYFVRAELPNIQLPQRRYHTTNDPVMTTDLLDYFFNQRTQVFEHLTNREKMLLHAIYDQPQHQKMLPKMTDPPKSGKHLRQHQRYSLKCPGNFMVQTDDNKPLVTSLRVVELSIFGFLAHADSEIPIRVWGDATVQLGNNEQSTVRAMAVRGRASGGKIFYGFTLAEPDLAWRKFVGALTTGITHEDLENATRFLED